MPKLEKILYFCNMIKEMLLKLWRWIFPVDNIGNVIYFSAYDIIERKFKKSDKKQVVTMMIDAFSTLMTAEELTEIETYLDSITNYDKSIVLDQNGEVVGFYLFGYRKLSYGIFCEGIEKVYVDLNKYDKKIGIEGVALVIKENYRKIGIATHLKDY